MHNKRLLALALVSILLISLLPVCTSQPSQPAPAQPAPTTAPAAKPTAAPAQPAKPAAQPTTAPAAAKPAAPATPSGLIAPTPPAAVAAKTGAAVPEPNPKTMASIIRYYGGASPGITSDILSRIVVDYIRTTFPDTRIRLMPAGTAEGAVKVETGEADLVTTSFSASRLGWDGKYEIYPKPMRNLRHLFSFPFLPGYLAAFMMTSRDSPVKDISDLYNKKIGMGPLTSTTNVMGKIGLAAYGITEESLKKNGGILIYPSWVENVELLAAGKIDAALMTVTMPYAQMTALHSSKGIRFLSWSDAALNAMAKDTYYPIQKGFDVAKYYPGAQPPTCDALNSWWGIYTHKDLPDETAFNIVAAVYKDNLKKSGDVIESWKGLDFLSSATQTILPVHPGAKKYWDMRGIQAPSKESVDFAKKIGITIG